MHLFHFLALKSAVTNADDLIFFFFFFFFKYEESKPHTHKSGQMRHKVDNLKLASKVPLVNVILLLT